MPSRPIALQKVYEAELFFLGQSFRICKEDKTQHAQRNEHYHLILRRSPLGVSSVHEGMKTYQQQVIEEEDLSL